MSGQDSYTRNIEVAQLGDASGSDSYRGRLEEYVVENDQIIKPGYFVAKGTGDNQAKIPSSGSDNILGLVYNGGRRVVDPETGLLKDYEQNDLIDVATEDVFYAYSEQAVDKFDDVFVRHTASGGNTTLGTARKDADVTSAVAINAKFHETTTGAGKAKVKLLMAQV